MPLRYFADLAKYFSEVARNEQSVKFIFDNVRNLGLVALVYGASHWRFAHLGDGFSFYLNYFFGVTLYIVGFVLMFINMESASHKITVLKFPLWAKVIFGVVYSQLILQVIAFLADNK